MADTISESFNEDDLPFKGFQLRESLWSNIEAIAPEHSENQIKKLIGQSLVDETLDLHAELSALYEIWKDFKQESHNLYKPLPEPPFLRENLEKQITVLVNLLQQKMLIQGKRTVVVLSKEERKIVKSISGGNSHSADPGSKSTIPSTITQNEYSSLPPLLSVDSSALQEGANIFEIDKLAEVLREDFEKERKQLLCDIQKIQQILISGCEAKEKEIRGRLSSPTIKELQHLNTKLEKEVLPPKKPNGLKNSKCSNNIRKPIKLSPSPPNTANTSSYKRPNMQSATNSRKLVVAKTILLPSNIGASCSKDSKVVLETFTKSPIIHETSDLNNIKSNSQTIYFAHGEGIS